MRDLSAGMVALLCLASILLGAAAGIGVGLPAYYQELRAVQQEQQELKKLLDICKGQEIHKALVPLIAPKIGTDK